MAQKTYFSVKNVFCRSGTKWQSYRIITFFFFHILHYQ